MYPSLDHIAFPYVFLDATYCKAASAAGPCPRPSSSRPASFGRRRASNDSARLADRAAEPERPESSWKCHLVIETHGVVAQVLVDFGHVTALKAPSSSAKGPV